MYTYYIYHRHSIVIHYNLCLKVLRQAESQTDVQSQMPLVSPKRLDAGFGLYLGLFGSVLGQFSCYLAAISLHARCFKADLA